MDLASLDTADVANEGVAMPVHGPDGQPVLQEDGAAVTITLLGDDSDELVKFDRQLVNRSLRGGQPITAELAEAKEISRLARATVGWSGIVLDGEVLKFSEENAKKLYKRLRWLRQQVRVFVADRANFMKASPES
ncbi:hypothetical protein [Brevundimonas viscosa]|jgi:hypothetical protein|uniref:Uncharacterized protein n=1 Tax=Brevundimonas viscosa TaxID=871741 RepID=A0A1I6PPT3_9CAUL|nr:hypothetical protein [Brevundimonas viscosa]SFS42233.1 hypothetical protein SAMN05192570_1166 [Brevundimonas viscosa]